MNKMTIISLKMFWESISFAWNSFFRGYLRSYLNERQCIDTLIYIVISSPSCYSWVIKWNVTPVTLISENNKAGILKTLFEIKLFALVE